jgi:hypothetical protein
MSELISTSAAFWIFATTVTLVAGGLIFYALYKKSNVFAKVSHGLTSFEIQADQDSGQRDA